MISKVLYGLRSSGAWWHDNFADTMRELNFFACKTEPDIWMCKSDKGYQYVAVYVDDLATAMKDPNYPFLKADIGSRLKVVVLLVAFI